ncbi:fumarylacetoacetate hydrolase family protein [Haematomicrobium sanguinis]|uniref:fumarylacetoacetate hydrolase family protein n=1 Tax=Haematomicrobium sanguinis TaxID=479106 RepID=UPI00047DFC41|nr:fumarylacetoacetate hydrolase family protein [Haematomicrobium sanguinis]
MRIANYQDRAHLIFVGTDNPAGTNTSSSSERYDGGSVTGIDIGTASGGTFGTDVAELYPRWAEFTEWARTAELGDAEHVEINQELLGAPSPAPTQILAVGLNYAEHADESGFDKPVDLPPVFTKFRSALTGPRTAVVLPQGGHTDWEVELAVVLGAELTRATPDQAREAIAGYTGSQDISERISQLRGPAPQFSLGKSYPGFLPTGPWLVTLDEFANPDDVALECSIDDEIVQQSSTTSLLFSVTELLSGLSQVITLYPGDLVLTGTPSGVGLGRNPQRYLQPGDVLSSRFESIGKLQQTFLAATE